MFCTGNIVKWDGELWIVSDQEDEDKIALISAQESNIEAYPSKTWPKDVKKRI